MNVKSKKWFSINTCLAKTTAICLSMTMMLSSLAQTDVLANPSAEDERINVRLRTEIQQMWTELDRFNVQYPEAVRYRAVRSREHGTVSFQWGLLSDEARVRVQQLIRQRADLVRLYQNRNIRRELPRPTVHEALSILEGYANITPQGDYHQRLETLVAAIERPEFETGDYRVINMVLHSFNSGDTHARRLYYVPPYLTSNQDPTIEAVRDFIYEVTVQGNFVGYLPVTTWRIERLANALEEVGIVFSRSDIADYSRYWNQPRQLVERHPVIRATWSAVNISENPTPTGITREQLQSMFSALYRVDSPIWLPDVIFSYILGLPLQTALTSGNELGVMPRKRLAESVRIRILTLMETEHEQAEHLERALQKTEAILGVLPQGDVQQRIETLSRAMERLPGAVTDEMLTDMIAYRQPGNIRDLLPRGAVSVATIFVDERNRDMFPYLSVGESSTIEQLLEIYSALTDSTSPLYLPGFVSLGFLPAEDLPFMEENFTFYHRAMITRGLRLRLSLLGNTTILHEPRFIGGPF